VHRATPLLTFCSAAPPCPALPPLAMGQAGEHHTNPWVNVQSVADHGSIDASKDSRYHRQSHLCRTISLFSLSSMFHFAVSSSQETCRPQRARSWSWRGRGSSCRTLSSCRCLTPRQTARWTGPTWWTPPRPLRVGTRVFSCSSKSLEVKVNDAYYFLVVCVANCHLYPHQKRALLVCICSFSKSNNTPFQLFSIQSRGWSSSQPKRRAPWLRVQLQLQPAVPSRPSLRQPR